MLDGITMFVAATLLNAFFPIEVTVLGMLMLTSFEHPLNAFSPIDVIRVFDI